MAITAAEIIKRKSQIIVKKGGRDYSNDPFFIKKAEKASASLKKYGLPKELQKNSK